MIVSVLLVDNVEVPKGSNEEEAKMKVESGIHMKPSLGKSHEGGWFWKNIPHSGLMQVPYELGQVNLFKAKLLLLKKKKKNKVTTHAHVFVT